MPGRKEFEQEYENDAEQVIKDMEFTDADTPQEVELKCAVLNIYHSILEARGERKKLIFDRGLVDFRKISNNEKKKPKEEKDLYAKMRVFARMQSKQDFDTFMEGLLGLILSNSRRTKTPAPHHPTSRISPNGHNDTQTSI